MKKLSQILSIILLMSTTSCNDFLDTVPDNRTEISDVEKLGKLVASSYPRGNYAVTFNARVDCVSDKGPDFHENIANTDPFFWRDVNSTTQDSPDYLWSQCYTAIAHSNQAIVSAATLGGDNAKEFLAEAKLTRAFSHFLLVSTFAQFYTPNAANDTPGIPYVVEPEDVIIKAYDRGTVASTYEKIEKDITQGLKDLGSDAKYRVPRYHFNVAAANALAVRFYLFKGEFDKVIKHALVVLPEATQFVDVAGGRNVSAQDPVTAFALNNFQPYLGIYSKASGLSQISSFYAKAENKSNLLLGEMVSSLPRYVTSWRYETKKPDTQATVQAKNATGGSWAYRVWSTKESFYSPKFKELFIRNSVNATSGTIYVVMPFFRNEEVLLSRAEAYVHMDQLQKALDDLNVFARQRIKLYNEITNALTVAKALEFYKTQLADSESFIEKYNAYDISTWSDERKAVLLMVLDFRHNEFMWEGLRYWDMWRYKMPITHTTFSGKSNTLYPGDDRWVLQIPETAKLSNIKLNPRTNLLSPVW